MSFIYSRALVEDYLQATSSETVLYALLNEMSGVKMFLCKGRTIELSQVSRFGTMYALLMEDHGKELWTWFLADSPVKRFLMQQEEEMLLKKIYGEKCTGLYEKFALHLSLQKTYPKSRSSKQSKILKVSDMNVNMSSYQRKTWVQTTHGKDFGYLHTPTTMANFAAPSMQKHKSCQNYVTVFGKVTPWSMEYLMGWPFGWNAIAPLEMGKFQSWQQLHFQD